MSGYLLRYWNWKVGVLAAFVAWVLIGPLLLILLTAAAASAWWWWARPHRVPVPMDHLAEVLPLVDMPVTSDLDRLVFGITDTGGPAMVQTTRSVCVSGLTQSGRSNFIRVLLAETLRQGIPVDLYVSDLKGGVEFSLLKAGVHAGGPLKVMGYATTAEDTVLMLTGVEQAMGVRQEWMRQQGVSRVRPGAGMPLVVVLLDDTVPLTGLLHHGVDSPMGRIAHQGPTAGYVVWAAVEAQSGWDLNAQMVYLEDQGVGTVGISRFRAALVSDEEAIAISAGLLPHAVMNAARAAHFRLTEAGDWVLYRCYYVDSTEYGNSLAYVGVGYDALDREVKSTAHGRAYADGPTRIETDRFDTKAKAQAALCEAVKVERPLHSKGS